MRIAQPLQAAGYKAVVPTPRMQEEIVHTSIYHPEVGIKAQSSPITGPARQWVEETIQALKREGAEVIILGCTEFPLAITEPVLFGIPIIDPTTILARALIREVAPGKLKPLVIPEAG